MTDQPQMPEDRCGFVAIVGRPNVGKSTLLNHILGQKISITSRKPQTTRQQILGIKTEGPVQAIYVDTPGLHQEQERSSLNRYMNRAATTALGGVDVVVFVTDRLQWTEGDERVLAVLKHVSVPVILAVNKIDQLSDPQQLLPHLDFLSKKHDFAEIVPFSALKFKNLDRLEQVVNKYLPTGPHHYPEDQITDRTQRFMAAELIREKVMRQLGAELPYSVAVEIESFEAEPGLLRIAAVLLVERPGQKRILIGERGSRMRQIGQEARVEMEKMFESKVMLHLWVKVQKGWADNQRVLRSLGFDDQ